MSSLSSVVSNLVRASMGTSVTSQVTDEELDKHVAELILKEAKKKAERFGQDGIRAYLRSGMCVILVSSPTVHDKADCNTGPTATRPAQTSVSCRPSFGVPMTITRRFCRRRRQQRRS
jgi:hypothetical protein